MTDKQLYRLCKKYGRRALEARRRFGGLLPEVLKRRLYEKKGFDSICVFAFKLAGMTRENVDTVLRLDRRFEDKPVLHQALVSGEISPNKLIRIASIATIENQRELIENAQKLSKQAIDVFVKDYRAEHCVGNGPKNDQKDGLFESESVRNSLSVQSFSPNHDFEILAKLLPEVKAKIKEMMDKGLDINHELMEFFREREGRIALEKKQIVHEQAGKSQTGESTRYIPAKIKKIIKNEFGSECAKHDCPRPAENPHHSWGFAIYRSHDPRHLQPLCKAHHEIEHINDSYVQKYRKFK